MHGCGNGPWCCPTGRRCSSPAGGEPGGPKTEIRPETSAPRPAAASLMKVEKAGQPNAHQGVGREQRGALEKINSSRVWIRWDAGALGGTRGGPRKATQPLPHLREGSRRATAGTGSRWWCPGEAGRGGQWGVTARLGLSRLWRWLPPCRSDGTVNRTLRGSLRPATPVTRTAQPPERSGWVEERRLRSAQWGQRRRPKEIPDQLLGTTEGTEAACRCPFPWRLASQCRAGLGACLPHQMEPGVHGGSPRRGLSAAQGWSRPHPGRCRGTCPRVQRKTRPGLPVTGTWGLPDLTAPSPAARAGEPLLESAVPAGQMALPSHGEQAGSHREQGGTHG